MLCDFEPESLFLSRKNGRVLLKEGVTEIVINERRYSCVGKMYLNLFDSSSINIDADFLSVVPQDGLVFLNVGTSKVDLFWEKKKIEGFYSKPDYQLVGQGLTLKWIVGSEDALFSEDSVNDLVGIKFHIFNFLNSSFPLKAEYNGWKISIRAVKNLKEAIDDLEFSGGFEVTHIGFIDRLDQSEFNAKDACDILDLLKLCLSFMSGKWIEPICCVGFNVAGDRIWERASSPRERWRSPLRWITQDPAAEFQELFPKFCAAHSKSDLWGATLSEVVYWYLNANNSGGGIDAGLILAQSAFEKLSFQSVVIDKKMISSEGFEKLNASDRIRMLASSLKISLSSASFLDNLAVFSKKNNIDDPIHAITVIRNSLVHARRKYDKGEVPYFDAWLLSLWLLEMSILALVGYTGKYRSRMRRNEIAPVTVPWAE